MSSTVIDPEIESAVAHFSDVEFSISRDFDAPRPLVYEAWTRSELMADWWGPHSFANPVCEMDVRPGGAYRIVMRSPDGEDYPVTGVFHEVAPEERLVMTMDCSGHPTAWHDLVMPDRAPGDDNPAGENLLVVSFEQIAGGTRLTVRTCFRTREIRDAFVRIGMNEGWSESLEQLTALLKYL